MSNFIEHKKKRQQKTCYRILIQTIKIKHFPNQEFKLEQDIQTFLTINISCCSYANIHNEVSLITNKKFKELRLIRTSQVIQRRKNVEKSIDNTFYFCLFINQQIITE